jgi:hypothetical protein
MPDNPRRSRRHSESNGEHAHAPERDTVIGHQPAASSVVPLVGCWYADPAHRPAVSWCPPACRGPVTHSERAGDGALLLYCEVHAYWRRKTIRLPLVRRIPPGSQPLSPGTGVRLAPPVGRVERPPVSAGAEERRRRLPIDRPVAAASPPPPVGRLMEEIS